MFEPKYTISHNLLNTLVKFETDKSFLSTKELSEQNKNELLKREKSLNLLHIGHLIGINLTVKDAEKIADGKRIETEDARGIILNNYRNLLEFNRSAISDSYVDIDLNILVHLNKILLTDWKQIWEAKFRTGGEIIENIYDNWMDYRERSIEASLIQDRLLEIVTWYKNNSSKINPIIRIAVLVYNLIRIYPFTVLNKLTIIGITDYLLYKNGYIQSTFIPIARVFDLNEDEFINVWGQASSGMFNNITTESQIETDITVWIEKFAKSLAVDINDAKESLNKLTIEDEKNVKQPFLDINKRQLKILKYLQTIPTVKREDYIQMMDVSTMTAYRDLNELVDKKLLKLTGRGRGTKYMLRSR